jgi:6-pyruvoyltetrahydropterin/6-carboxytetrahydropterin synthase
MIIEKKYHFYAAHRNKNADAKCARIHGHTYFIKCYFDFSSIGINPVSGVTMLFSNIDKLVEPLIKSYCHYLLLYEKDSLCQVLELENEPFIKLPFETSAENLALWLFNQINNETQLPIYKIELRETLSSKVIYEIKS